MSEQEASSPISPVRITAAERIALNGELLDNIKRALPELEQLYE